MQIPRLRRPSFSDNRACGRQRDIDLELIAELIRRGGAFGLGRGVKYLQRSADEAESSAD